VPARHRSVRVDVDPASGGVGLACLEAAAVDFARRAPGELIAAAVESMTAELFDLVVGAKGFPLDDDAQPEAPWSWTKCGSHRGFRRRGRRPGGRTVLTRGGRVRLDAWQLECRRCGRRFVPMIELLGLGSYQRRSTGVAEMAAALATGVAYAKAARLLAELAGVDLSARSVGRDLLSLAPARVGPEIVEVPVLLDGTGVRAGDPRRQNNGVELHLAVGLVARRREGGRIVVGAGLLGATLGEPWSAMGRLLAGVRPGLVIVDGEEAITDLAVATFGAKTPIQRCLFHLERQTRGMARYLDRLPAATADELQQRLHALLVDTYATGDLDTAVDAYNTLIDTAESLGAAKAVTHLRNAAPHAFTFATHPGAGRLLFGDKGRPELATGVLERVMREMNRRTDVGVRWSIPGVRGMVKAKPQRKYAHGRWSATAATTDNTTVRFTLVA